MISILYLTNNLNRTSSLMNPNTDKLIGLSSYKSCHEHFSFSHALYQLIKHFLEYMINIYRTLSGAT